MSLSVQPKSRGSHSGMIDSSPSPTAAHDRFLVLFQFRLPSQHFTYSIESSTRMIEKEIKVSFKSCRTVFTKLSAFLKNILELQTNRRQKARYHRIIRPQQHNPRKTSPLTPAPFHPFQSLKPPSHSPTNNPLCKLSLPIFPTISPDNPSLFTNPHPLNISILITKICL